MNIRRFTARSSREALRLVRQALGDDAAVLSTKPSAGGGVEVLAMAPDALGQLESMATSAATVAADATPVAPVKKNAKGELASSSVEEDASRLQMSTLSFQDYVRTRMLKRRQAALGQSAVAPSRDTAMAREPANADVRLDDEALAAAERSQSPAALYAAAAAATARDDERAAEASISGTLEQRAAARAAMSLADARSASLDASRSASLDPSRGASLVDDLRAGEAVGAAALAAADAAFDAATIRFDQSDMLAELRSVKGLIEERFGTLAFMERLQRRPAEARLTQKLLDCGFSPMLVRKIADGLKADVGDEAAWAAQVLERNLLTTENETALEDRSGVFALVGATGVGKTTTTAKIAAAFAAKHGAGHLGLITLDAYRVGAHEQLRAYGRILGVPVHTAHDRASLEDLLDLLTAKKMVLIDTAGMAQRDARTRELLDMLSHRSIQRILVVNAASQGETIEDVVIAYRAAGCAGVALSKIDEAVKLGPALDAAIRHKLRVVGVANGQRVPEDWHRLSASALVQRALRSGGSSAWKLDAAEMNLVFASPREVAPQAAVA